MRTRTLLILLFFGLVACQKEKYEHNSADFSWADEYAGTFTGMRSIWHTNQVQGPVKDTITVNVSDYRTDSECQFHIDYYDEVFNVKRDGRYVSNWVKQTDSGYFYIDLMFSSPGYIGIRERFQPNTGYDYIYMNFLGN